MNTQKIIGVDDLIEKFVKPDKADQLAVVTIEMVNMLAEVFSHIRTEDKAPDMESVIISAAITYAGCVHGEMVGLNLVGDLTDEALTKMLVTNFRSGQRAGQNRVKRVADQLAADTMAASGQEQAT